MKKTFIWFICLSSASLFFLTSCKKANFEQMVEEANKKTVKEISFKDDVWPIMQTNCGLNDNSCHSFDNKGSGFQWIGYETVYQKQVTEGGKFYRAINWENSDSNKNMPQGKPKLDQPSLDLIKKWIDAGLPNN